MKRGTDVRVVWVTAPDPGVARELARALLEARLVACVNLVPGLESHYWWQGRIETAAEVLLMMKTTDGHLEALEREVLARHPYETPEFVVLPVEAGSEGYLKWVEDQVGPEEGRKLDGRRSGEPDLG
jgi:periplasmic divalent cation tolerance protein